ncbi:aromatic amino acid decarboxylase [Capsaspora owczarzaki ATCC 30864]|uniref:aromatic amino acid decarboxylase n=1 Tax=Capsaspora owczarzaki (strain ATCC 30864) TaxID=595528 RepID=UPI0001FE5993|nr:aromatic amino acid decarboxylase [Capsaspora owczarzaki ATCC 30864]|eukprot:XP_004345610.1 aromatic amino acid decarboxylase [Capsaspora owczarzaki ATCC 30864]
MDAAEFRKRGHEMVDYIANYYETMRERPVMSEVSPGYLRPLIPAEAPAEGESWESIVADVERVIMPGVTHWQHPRFHAYFPGGSSFPSILGDMLSDAIACVGFNWVCSPACTELETVVLDWLGRAVGLPDAFLAQHRNGENGHGGGVIQGTASEAVLVCMLAARAKAINELRAAQTAQGVQPEDEGIIMARLIAYGSESTHACIEKAARVSGVRFRAITTGADHRLVAANLTQAIAEDRAAGLIPFFVCSTSGTTSTCAYDDHVGLGAICNAEKIWLHIDAAYAGAAYVCPEFRSTMAGVEQRHLLISAFNITPEYLRNAMSESGLVTDYRNWQVPLGRRFRSLKLWFVLRSYGIAGLQAHIRKAVGLASRFDALVRKDDRFEVVYPTTLSLVCFRLKGDNELSSKLLEAVSAAKLLLMIHTVVKGVYILRFSIGAPQTTEADIDSAWAHIASLATGILANHAAAIPSA